MKAGSPLVRKTHMRTWFDTQFQKVNRPLATRQRIPSLGGKDLWAGWVSTGPESPRFEGSSSPKAAAPRPIKRAPTVGLHRCHLTTLRVTVKLQSPVSLFSTPQALTWEARPICKSCAKMNLGELLLMKLEFFTFDMVTIYEISFRLFEKNNRNSKH